MPNITLHVAGRNYPITCGEGEEEHAASLAKSLDSKIAAATNGQPVTEIRGLLFGGLLIADALKEAEANVKKSEKSLRKALKTVAETEARLAEAAKSEAIQAEAPKPDADNSDLLSETVNKAMIANAVKALDQLAERIETLADHVGKQG